jgi:Electron transfer DM13
MPLLQLLQSKDSAEPILRLTAIRWRSLPGSSTPSRTRARATLSSTVLDGSHVLRLENPDIFNGPALYVYAVGAQDAEDSETVEEAGFLSLGPLKGNQGNQTYELPARFDPEKHRSISIWCKRFSVNFATAPLR